MMTRFTGPFHIVLLALATVVPCDASIMFTGGTIGENFDGMPTSSATPPTTLASPFSSVTNVQAAVTGAGGWEGTRIAGTSTAAMPFVADNGNGNSGGIYSYGAAEAAERALGGLASGSNTAAWGVEIVNGVANQIITEITVSFTQENWRSSTSSTGTPNTVNASYSTTDSGGLTGDYLSATTGFSDVDMLDLVGPAPVATNGPLDGNDAANQAARTATISGLSIDPSESFFLRFQDFNDQGNDAGLAIDNVEIQFVTIPEPAALAMLALGLLALALRGLRWPERVNS